MEQKDLLQIDATLRTEGRTVLYAVFTNYIDLENNEGSLRLFTSCERALDRLSELSLCVPVNLRQEVHFNDGSLPLVRFFSPCYINEGTMGLNEFFHENPYL